MTISSNVALDFYSQDYLQIFIFVFYLFLAFGWSEKGRPENR